MSNDRHPAALTLVRAYDGWLLDWLRERVDLTHSGTVRLVDRLAGRGLLARALSNAYYFGDGPFETARPAFVRDHLHADQGT